MGDKTLDQMKVGLFYLLVVVIGGTASYMLVEDWDVFDSLYMTIITISTTGFAEVKPLSVYGRIVTMGILIMGIASIAYIGGRGAQLLIEKKFFRRRMMSKKIGEMKDHYIVCGYGRMGSAICEELVSAKAPFVVIENNTENIEKLEYQGYLYINGDGSSDEALLEAGIDRAKGLVAVLSNDAENVFTTLSAKVLNPNVYVVARAINEGSDSKLHKAGANKVVKPYEFGGLRMAKLLLRPGVIDFMDIATSDKHIDLSFEEVSISENSTLVGKTLMELPLRKEFNIIIVAIYKSDGKFTYNPKFDTKIEAGDRLIAVGEMLSFVRFNKICFGEENLEF